MHRAPLVNKTPTTKLKKNVLKKYIAKNLESPGVEPTPSCLVDQRLTTEPLEKACSVSFLGSIHNFYRQCCHLFGFLTLTVTFCGRYPRLSFCELTYISTEDIAATFCKDLSLNLTFLFCSHDNCFVAQLIDLLLKES